MDSSQVAETKLEMIVRALEQKGEADLAREVGNVLNTLREESAPYWSPGPVMTTGEAAAFLGVRSINTVKRWAKEGLLEGFRRGDRVFITRRSVERMARNPLVTEQKTP